MPEAFRNTCKTDLTFKGGPNPKRGLLGLTQERTSKTMQFLIKDDNHRCILEINMTWLMLVQPSHPASLHGNEKETLGQNWEKRGKVEPTQTSWTWYRRQEEGNSTHGFCYGLKRQKQGFWRKWQGLGTKKITFLSELCLDLEVVLMLLLKPFCSAKQFVFPRPPSFPSLPFRRQCKAKTNSN